MLLLPLPAVVQRLSTTLALCEAPTRFATQCAASACRQFHSTSSSSSDAGAGEDTQPAASTSGNEEPAAASAAAKPRGRARAPHISLDDPELNIYLRYNTQFVTDPDRSYAIGHRNAFERLTRQELRKALAAQRLALQDEAAARAAGPAGAKQLPMREQMLLRLAEMQQAAAGR